MDLEQVAQGVDLLGLVGEFELHPLPLLKHLLLKSTQHDWNFGLQDVDRLRGLGVLLLCGLEERLELSHLGGEVAVLGGQKLDIILQPPILLHLHTQLRLHLFHLPLQLLEVLRVLLQVLMLDDLVALILDQGVDCLLYTSDAADE